MLVLLKIYWRSHVFLLPFLVIFLISGACSKNSEQDRFSAVADVELTSIRNDLEVYGSLTAKSDANKVLKLKVAQSILRHVMLVRTVNPEVKFLRGEQLETICLLTEPETREILNQAGDPPLASLAHEYLLLIEPEVRKKIEGYQKTMKGLGCYLSPK